MKRRLCRPFVWLLPLLLGAAIAPIVSSHPSKLIKVSEISLRKLATKTVLPDFPEEAKKRGAKGVAVAQLEVDEKGDVAQVEVLEAPDPLIKKAVADATKQWKFKPSASSGEPVRIQGKLTFYYVIDRNEARVENPRQPK